MTEATAPAAAPEQPSVVDNAVHAADGTRKAAAWLASALGAIPGIAIVTTLVRAPGDDGLDPVLLVAGVLLAGLGAFLGLAAFAWVMAPVPLTDDDMDKFPMSSLPGHTFPTFDDLTTSIRGLSYSSAAFEAGLARATRLASDAKAAAIAAEQAAQGAEEVAAKPGATAKEVAAARAARAGATSAKQEQDRLEALAAAAGAEVSPWSSQLEARLRLRSDAYLMEASRRVGQRFTHAMLAGMFSVIFVALGIACLALAPNSPSEPAAAAAAQTTTLVSITSDDAVFRAAVDCPDATIYGLRVGGTDAKPLVITLPSASCPNAKYIGFPLGDAASVGKVTVVKVVPSPSPSPVAAAPSK